MNIRDFAPKRESVDRLAPGRLIPNDRALEKVMRLDRKWFAQNPDRHYRARPFDTRKLQADALDAPLYGHARWTLVRRISDGVRGRVFLTLPLAAAPADRDESIGTFFDKCLEGGGFHYFPIKHLRLTGKPWPNPGTLAHWNLSGARYAQ
jgi:hypothetical protein